MSELTVEQLQQAIRNDMKMADNHQTLADAFDKTRPDHLLEAYKRICRASTLADIMRIYFDQDTHRIDQEIRTAALNTEKQLLIAAGKGDLIKQVTGE